MRKIRQKKGFTLVELILVLTLLGIVAVPVVQSVIDTAKRNAKAKHVMDANLLAGKLVEQIEISGPDSAGFDFSTVSTVTVNKSVNGSDYSVTCTQGTDNKTDTGSFIIPGFNDYYLLDFGDTDVNLSHVSGVVSTSLDNKSFSENDCSLVINSDPINGDNIRIYSPDDGSLTPLSAPAPDPYVEFTGSYEIFRNLRLKNSRSSSDITIRLYNNVNPASTVKAVNIFYDSSLTPKFNFNIKFDNNICTRDLKDVNPDDTIQINKVVYTLTIKKNASDTESLVTRAVTRVSQ